jgi:rare lipoprotein A
MRTFLAALIFCASLSAAHAAVASCYGRENHQFRTAQGKPYDPSLLTAAHRTLPFGTTVRVTLRNGRFVTVRINDRGPYVRGRDIDLSLGSCRALGFSGVAPVSLQVLR